MKYEQFLGEPMLYLRGLIPLPPRLPMIIKRV